MQPSPYYWEFSPEDRAEIDHLITGDEGGLATDINWGRALIGVRPSLAEVPDLDLEPEVLDGLPESYSDAVAAILQAAAYRGLDPREVCEGALFTQQAILNSHLAYDFRSDSLKGDPDKFSPTLRRCHQLLWSMPLPSEASFELEDGRPGNYLVHRSDLSTFTLSSHASIATLRRGRRSSSRLGTDALEEFQTAGSLTIGYIISRQVGLPRVGRVAAQDFFLLLEEIAPLVRFAQSIGLTARPSQ